MFSLPEGPRKPTLQFLLRPVGPYRGTMVLVHQVCVVGGQLPCTSLLV